MNIEDFLINKVPAYFNKRVSRRKASVAIVTGASFGIGGILFGQKILSGLETIINTVSKHFKSNLQDEYNYLLIGRDDEGRTADALVVLNVHPKEKRVNIVSIPRDSKVEIEGRGWSKASHAYCWGGNKLQVSTIENFLETKMNGYVYVDFKSFKSWYQTIAGLNEELKYNRIENSNTALEHLRNRKYKDYAIGRAKELGRFVNYVLRKSLDLYHKSPELVSKTLIMASMGIFDTNIPSSELFLIGDSFTKGDTSLVTYYIPGRTNNWPEEGTTSYWLPTPKPNTFNSRYIDYIIRYCDNNKLFIERQTT